MPSTTPYERVRNLYSRISRYIPELHPEPAPLIKDYGPCPYFYKLRLGTRDLVEKFNGDMLPSISINRSSSVPRDSIGAHSDEVKIQDFQWLMNKKLTCVLLWLGVIILIVGIIALQIASFFLHKRQDILSIGVGCLSSGLCLLFVTLFTFLHAHVFIYKIPEEDSIEHQEVTRKEDQVFVVEEK
ncbi:unnamed protein product [Heterobilharzia americana]|nr:unnamed protein product [Heterobilharzia americana]CAH8540873.1 unnamed protein product [Heterobilharzia americana]